MVGTAGLPHVIVRFFTVPKVKDARISAGYALVFIAILYTTAPAISAFARTNLIETIHNKPYDKLPSWVINWKKTGLIEFKDKNGDGIIQYLGDLSKNEVKIDKDIIVLANPEIAKLPNWVIALVAAGGLAQHFPLQQVFYLLYQHQLPMILLKNNGSQIYLKKKN